MAINQTAYDYQNIAIDVAGTEIDGARSISYEHGIESAKIFGSGRESYDYTDGVYNVEDVELTLLWYAYQNLKDTLGNGYMTKAAKFDVSVTYAHDNEPTVTDILQECRIIRDAHDHSQGSEGLEVSITLQVKKLILNGVDPVNA